MRLDAGDLIGGCAVADAVATLGQKVELVWDREHEVIDPPAPVLPNRGRTLKDGHEIFVRKAESANMGAGKAEVFHRSHHQRCAFQPLRFLFPLQSLNEFVRDDAARSE